MNFELYSLAWWGFLVAGLGIFILGITFLGDGLKKVAGSKLKNIIDRFTSNPIKGIFVGMGVTALMQSSSGTTALSIGLIRVGLMSLPQALGVIMGANIGTTVTAFLIGLDVGAFAPFVLVIGAFLYLFANKNKSKSIGEVLFGFGCLFMGLELMDITLKLLANDASFINLISSFNTNPIIGLVVGTLGTAAIQSSSAFIGIIQSMYEALGDNITLIAVLPLLFGSNIGTTITAILASLGGSVPAKRAALFHVLFNVIGSILFLILLYPYADFITIIINTFNLSPKMQIAIAHIIFNVVTTLVLLPFLHPLTSLIQKIIPGKVKETIELNFEELEHGVVPIMPAAALEIAHKQVIKLGNLALEGVKEVYNFFTTGDKESGDQVFLIENMIDSMDKKLSHYLLEMSQGDLDEDEINRYGQIMNVIKDFERISDHCENLCEFFKEAIDRNEKFCEPAVEEIGSMLQLAISIVEDALKSYTTGSSFVSAIVYDKETKMDQFKKEYRENHISRMITSSVPSTSFVSMVYIDVISNIERIADHANNIAEASQLKHSTSTLK